MHRLGVKLVVGADGVARRVDVDGVARIRTPTDSAPGTRAPRLPARPRLNTTDPPQQLCDTLIGEPDRCLHVIAEPHDSNTQHAFTPGGYATAVQPTRRSTL